MLYEAALDPARWGDALTAVATCCGGFGAYLYSVGDGRTVPFAVSAGLPQALHDEYEAHYIHDCPRLGYLLAHPDESLLYDYKFISDREIARSDYYDWLQRVAGARYLVGGRISQEDDEQVFLGVQRTRRQGHVQADEIALFAALAPHIGRAVRLARVFETTQARLVAFEAMVERAVVPLLLLAGDGRIVHVNSAARRLLAADDGLGLDHDRLVATHAEDSAPLGHLLSSALSWGPAAAALADTVRVRRPSGRRAYLVRAIALPASTGHDANLKAAVIVTDPEHCDVDAALLQNVLGFTATEARIAMLLAGGLSLAQVATLSGMAFATARRHLEHVFLKAGVRKQHDLVRLVLTVAPTSSTGAQT